MTYDPIASTTLASSASSVTFSSLDTIAAGYRDLVLVVEAKVTSGTANARFLINSDTGNNYFAVAAEGDGSTASSLAFTRPDLDTSVFYAAMTNTESVLVTLSIFDFAQTNKHKSVLMKVGRAGGGKTMTAARWGNTAAITTIQALTSGANFAAGSTFSLYGIAA